MAEHQLEEVIGLSFDGTGYGTDGTIWGGEFLHATRGWCRRLGCFRPFLLPGGEAAVLNPQRIALALLREALSGEELERLFCVRLGMPLEALETLIAMIDNGVNSPVTTSLGRIFDAAASLLELVRTTSYEGEGPIRMEGLATKSYLSETPEPLPELVPCTTAEEGLFHLDPTPLIQVLVQQYEPGQQGHLALLFHSSIAAAAVKGACALRQSTGIDALALSGGVFQNSLLQDLLLPELLRKSFTVYTNQSLPPGDGGIAAGQVYFQADSS
jgi:hydrogenase maturation protein HypF